jgi:hypothetical protein
MPSPRVNRGLCRSLSLAAILAATFAFSANCSSSSLGPANGSSCNVNSDCASNCCLAGGYPSEGGTDYAKVCTEPAGCAGEDSSTSASDSSTQDSTAADTGSGQDSSTPIESGTPDTGTAEQDSSSPEDTGAPKDSGKKD